MKLLLNTGAEIEADVRKFTIGEYEKLFTAWSAESEPRFIARALVPADPNGPLPSTLVDQLDQDSYEELATVVRQENRGFFAFCYRTSAERISRNPAMVQGLLRQAAAEAATSRSANTSRNSQSQPG